LRKDTDRKPPVLGGEEQLDRQDVGGALGTLVEPGEEPVPSTEHEASQLTLSSVVRRFDVPVVEIEQQPWPLAVQVTEALAERRLRWRDRLLACDPLTKLVEDRSTAPFSSFSSLVGVVATARGLALDREETRDDAHALEATRSPPRAASTSRRRA
jgi:hypothetical protein